MKPNEQMTLRPYQSEDVESILTAHQSHRCVLGRAATGLGKACELAFVAQHYAGLGRVMVLVDVGKLVLQLAATISKVVGIAPGIEMGDEAARDSGFLVEWDRIIVGTVQSQYSGDVGKERFRKFNPNDFSALLLDECELFLAPKAREVVAWYMQNPNLKVYGCTATPMRTDGTAMANLFEHVAFDRDIIWGIRSGYLVPVKQAFVRVSLDFSTLKLRKNDEGEADYSDAELAEKINNEQTLIELAKGIIHVAGDRKSIIVAPDVESAKAISHYLEGQGRTGCAKVIYGELPDDEKDKLFEQHKAGDFQFLSSVMMLTKGYDDPSIRAVFNCRKTKSKRLYQQILGRGTRPHFSIVEAINAAISDDERRGIIATSMKPDCLMVNMVGVAESTRDMTVLDILGNVDDPDVMDRAKEIVAENEDMTADEAISLAEDEIAVDRSIEQMRAEAAAHEVDAIDEQRAMRRLVEVQANVEVEYSDELRGGGDDMFGPSIIPDGQMRIFRMAKIDDKELNKLSPEQKGKLAQAIMAWKHSSSGATFKQGRTLQKYGYSRDEAAGMSFDDARAAIDEIADNGWKRAKAGVA